MVILDTQECSTLLYYINTNWTAIKNSPEHYNKYVEGNFEEKLEIGHRVIFTFEDYKFLKKLTKL